jgi:hypothetical protein
MPCHAATPLVDLADGVAMKLRFDSTDAATDVPHQDNDISGVFAFTNKTKTLYLPLISIPT